MPKRSSRAALSLLVVAGLILVGAGYLAWQHFQTPSAVATRGMAAGSVVSSTPSGADVTLTVGYVAGGQRLQANGTVSAAAFDQQGKVVWVCFNPASPKETVLRLPMDPLCANGG